MIMFEREGAVIGGGVRPTPSARKATPTQGDSPLTQACDPNDERAVAYQLHGAHAFAALMRRSFCGGKSPE